MLDEIQAALNEQLQNKTAFEIPLFGGIPVPASAVVTWVIILLLTLLAIWLTHDLKERPGRRQAAAEMFVGFINNFCQEILGEKYWRTFAPYLGTIGLYLLFANLSGLFGVGTAHQRFECDSGLGDHEPGADLRFPVPLSRAGRWTEEIWPAVRDHHAAERDGGWHPAARPVYAAVRQHFRGLYHYGAD